MFNPSAELLDAIKNMVLYRYNPKTGKYAYRIRKLSTDEKKDPLYLKARRILRIAKGVRALKNITPVNSSSAYLK